MLSLIHSWKRGMLRMISVFLFWYVEQALFASLYVVSAAVTRSLLCTSAFAIILKRANNANLLMRDTVLSEEHFRPAPCFLPRAAIRTSTPLLPLWIGHAEVKANPHALRWISCRFMLLLLVLPVRPSWPLTRLLLLLPTVQELKFSLIVMRRWGKSHDCEW